MPKANGKDAFYFPHDCNARNDNKILALRSIYGSEGYGIYWMIIEVLRDQPGYKYPLGKFAFKGLAMELHCDSKLLEDLVMDCCTEFVDDSSSLLSMDDNYLWSVSLLRRMKNVDEISEVRKAAAQKRWDSKANANALQLQSKEKKSKEEKSKVKKSIPEERKGEQDMRVRAIDLSDLSSKDVDLGFVRVCDFIGSKPTDRQAELFKEYFAALGPSTVADEINRCCGAGSASWSFAMSMLSIRMMRSHR